MNDLLFGKDSTENVVSISVEDNITVLYREIGGVIKTEVRPNKFWIVSHYPTNDSFRLKGDRCHYKFITEFEDRQEFVKARQYLRKKDIWSIYDEQEQFLVKNGVTYYKGMKLQDISVLSFDIEALGLVKDETSKVIIISNTLRKNGVITKKLFKYDDYESDSVMIDEWAAWVREVDPSIMCGHNIFGYDLPYMQHCYEREYSQTIPLGRDNSGMRINSYTSQKRKDGSQEYGFQNIKVLGRELIDTMFRAFDFDKTRKEGAYISYGLKQIIKEEGLEKVGRQHYDAAKIKDNYRIPEEWTKIIAYATDDADDALALFDLMMPSAFYFCQHIPKTLQQIVNSATGSQLNSFMVRAYIQNNEGLPKASEGEYVAGGISFAVPGIYKNLLKVDLKSAYPSQILRFKLFDRYKDPHGYFYEMVKYFTYERFDLKTKYQETGDRYYYDREQSSKIGINSAFGLCNTPGLIFNSPPMAAKITKETRDVLSEAIYWASSKTKDEWFNLFLEKTGQLDA